METVESIDFLCLCMCISHTSQSLCVLLCVAAFTGCLEWGVCSVAAVDTSCSWPSKTPLQLSPRRPHGRGGGLHQPSLQCTTPDVDSCRAFTLTIRPYGAISCIFRINYSFTLINIHNRFLFMSISVVAGVHAYCWHRWEWRVKDELHSKGQRIVQYMQPNLQNNIIQLV